MLTWHYVSSAEYNAAEAATKTADKLYFLSDTKQIYRGTDLFTEACTVVESWPTTPAVGRLYVLSSTLEGKIYNGSAWVTVIQPVQAAVDVADTTKPVSGKAVADYVAAELQGVSADADNAFVGASYDKASQSITFTRNSGEDAVVVEIDDLPVDLVYDQGTGLLQLKDADGAAIGAGINLDLERFVKSGSYDPATKKITLVFNDDAEVEIDATALVDIYTGEETGTVAVSVSADNKISATAKVSAEAKNILVAKDDGLYVPETDLSAYATTQAVEAIRSTLQGNIDTVSAAVTAEKERAEAAEAQLTTDLGAEVTRAKAAEGELDTAVKAAQKAADDEAARAKAAEAELDTAVKAAQAQADKGVADAAAEKTRAEAAEAELDTAVKAAQAQADKGVADAAAEKTRAEAAEAGLQEQITGNDNDIAAINAALEWKTTV